MVARPQARLLVASSDGRGFVTPGEATLAETRKGKQLVNLRPGARVAVVREIPTARTRSRPSARTAKCWCSPGRAPGAGPRARRDVAALSRWRTVRCHCLPLRRRFELGIGRRQRPGAHRNRPDAVARGARGGWADAAAGLPENQPFWMKALRSRSPLTILHQLFTGPIIPGINFVDVGRRTCRLQQNGCRKPPRHRRRTIPSAQPHLATADDAALLGALPIAAAVIAQRDDGGIQVAGP